LILIKNLTAILSYKEQFKFNILLLKFKDKLHVNHLSGQDVKKFAICTNNAKIFFFLNYTYTFVPGKSSET